MEMVHMATQRHMQTKEVLMKKLNRTTSMFSRTLTTGVKKFLAQPSVSMDSEETEAMRWGFAIDKLSNDIKHLHTKMHKANERSRHFKQTRKQALANLQSKVKFR
jgi:hypothetical protein